MNRSLRWTLIMAILGFILGLGFLVPVGPVETRAPASDDEGKTVRAVAFVEPIRAPAPRPDLRDLEISYRSQIFFGDYTVDRRADVLFDVHTISRSSFAKDTDAYVTTRFKPGGRAEINYFTYCHNYDYNKQRARTQLNRYSLGNDGFNCYAILLSELAAGYVLIDTPLGEVLTLKSQAGFDPKRGGTISVIFAYRVAKIGRNDYRRLDLELRLLNGVIKVTGPTPKNAAVRPEFDWFNLKMTEDIFGLPNGVNSFELFFKGAKVADYAGKTFPSSPKTKTK